MRRYGWLPDHPDHRDYNQEHPKIAPLTLKAIDTVYPTPNTLRRPEKKDLRAHCSPIEDQQDLGSCTAQAGAGLMEWFQRKVYGKHLDMSRLFLYLVSRQLAGIKGDEGCYLRTTMQAMLMIGIPPERYWPYRVADFNKEPPGTVFSLAQKFQAFNYYRLAPTKTKSQLDVLLDQLAGGLPFMFGFTVFSSISNDPWIPSPKAGDSVEGGHAVMACGYDMTMGALLIRNSWGRGWGHDGYGWLPFSYITMGLADDFWGLGNAGFIDTDLFKVEG